MKYITICGGRRLEGEVAVHSAKNAILPILAACILCKEAIVLENCPMLRDVENMLLILRELGCEVQCKGNSLEIDARLMNSGEVRRELSGTVRSSIFMLGSILARQGSACLAYPGGCEIGNRPIDLHLRALRSMGAEIEERGGFLCCECKRLRGCEIYLDYPSVGATENVMLAAVLAEGTTIIHNPAREPEIVDLERFINLMGGRVSGSGGSAIVIEGVQALHSCVFAPMADRIVAGTYLLAGAIAGGEIYVRNAQEEHLGALCDKLIQSGFSLLKDQAGIVIRSDGRKNCAPEIETMPYPGFATDLQAQMMSLQAVSKGVCVMRENVFENRFKHAAELCRMGADIRIKDRTAVIKGVKALRGAHVTGHDLRGSAALILAGLAAEGITEIEDRDYLSRGYFEFEKNLEMLGACISYTEAEAWPELYEGKMIQQRDIR